MVTIGIISILNLAIYEDFQFSFDATLNESSILFFWWRKTNETANSSEFCENNFYLGLYIVLKSIIWMRDLHQELFILFLGILPLWLISNDFKKFVNREVSKLQITYMGHVRSKTKLLSIKSIKPYREVYKLTELFKKSHGFLLVSYMFMSILYYSLRFDSIVLAEKSIGLKLIRLQYVCTLVPILGLGAAFSRNVKKNIGKLNYSF